jgi:hypothetical protein
MDTIDGKKRMFNDRESLARFWAFSKVWRFCGVSGDFLFSKSGSFLECLEKVWHHFALKRRNTPRMIPEISQTRQKNSRNQTEINRNLPDHFTGGCYHFPHVLSRN